MRLLPGLATLTLLVACSSSSPAPSVPLTAHDAGALESSTVPPDSGAGDAVVPADAGDTWKSYAQGFFARYCVECHTTGNAHRDYSAITDVERDHVLIRCGVAPTQVSGCTGSPAPAQFPIDDATGTNPKPSGAERARLVAWIEAGLPQ